MIVCLVYNNGDIVNGEVYSIDKGKLYTDKELKQILKKENVTYKSDYIFDKKFGLMNENERLQREKDKNNLHKELSLAITDRAYRALSNETMEEAVKNQEYDNWVARKFWKKK